MLRQERTQFASSLGNIIVQNGPGVAQTLSLMPHTFCQSCKTGGTGGADPLVRAGRPRPAAGTTISAPCHVVMPSTLNVGVPITNLTVALGATPPEISTSRSDSPSSPGLIPLSRSEEHT